MKIAVACDNAAFVLKTLLIPFIESLGHEVYDAGTYTEERCDYPLFAEKAAKKIVSGECERGVLLCGTGVGMALAANKIRGIRCAACNETYSTEMIRRHNDANMLAVGARVVGQAVAERIVQVFLETPFGGDLPGGERHKKRVEMIMALESGTVNGSGGIA